MLARIMVAIAVFSAALLDLNRAVADEEVDYVKQIKPILAERCIACHGALKQRGRLRVDTAALAIKGGKNGSAIKPGDPAGSLLLRRVTAADESERMPPEGKPLTPVQIALLKQWIAQQAKAPADEEAEKDPRDHWAFKPRVRPPVPAVADAKWVRNPLDAFIARQHEKHGLKPQAEAPRELLVRRLYLDLVGVPPSSEDFRRLDQEQDEGEGWYQRLVERLLADPRYGERWGRHWMDIWRYSDWWGLGDQLRNSQKHIWHWRDWIIDSLNAGLPYDEMVRQMLAADELYPNDLGKLRATGFLARNYFLFNRNQWMDETVEHVGKTFLGLTLNCAKCHDHKFDPFPQADYYRMRAFFEPYHVRNDVLPGEPDLVRDGIPRVFDAKLDAPTYLFVRGQETQPDKAAVISPGVPAIVAYKEPAIHPVQLPVEAWQPERRPWVLDNLANIARKGVTTAEAAVASAQMNLKAKPRADAESELRLAEQGLLAAQAELRSVESRAEALRAEWNKLGPEKERAQAVDAIRAERQAALAKAQHNVAAIELRLLRSPADKKGPIEKELSLARAAAAKAEKFAAAAIGPKDTFTRVVGAKWSATRFFNSSADDPAATFQPQSTGRRKALAEWIADANNPLTARVAVNHLWTRHMGTALVPTVFEFGRKGTPPTNPELLDWLASEFVDSGWSMKHVHRLIVTSATYRMSSSNAGREANLARDADNIFWWRRVPIRLESQVVRDSILALAGTLDPRRGGPSVSSQADSTRRSIYLFHSNNERNLFLTTFDEATVKECYRREQSIVPQQALALANSGIVLDATRRIAERLSAENADDVTFVRRAFTNVLGISASEREIAASTRALEAWRKLPDGAAARANFVWALINHNDFVTLR